MSVHRVGDDIVLTMTPQRALAVADVIAHVAPVDANWLSDLVVLMTSVATPRAPARVVSRSDFLRGAWAVAREPSAPAPSSVPSEETHHVATTPIADGVAEPTHTAASELFAARLAATVSAAAMIEAERTAVEMAMIASTASADASDASAAAAAAAAAYKSEVARSAVAAEVVADAVGIDEARQDWERVAAQLLVAAQRAEVAYEDTSA